MADASKTLDQIKNIDEFEKLVKSASLAVIHFMAPWAAQCESITNIFKELGGMQEFKGAVFAEVEAEALPEICLARDVTSVPTVLYYRNGECIDRVDGVKISELTNKVKNHMSAAPTTLLQNDEPEIVQKKAEPIEERLKKIINKEKIMLFMKGNPEQPRCGFSRTITEILKSSGVSYGTFDILEDEEVRQSLKTFSDWHTYPQLYVNGELVGGLDIVKELQQSGELQSTLAG